MCTQTNTHRNPPPSKSTIHSSSMMGSYPSNGLCSLDHPAHQTSTPALPTPRLATRVRSPSAPILPHTEKRNEGVDPQPSPHRSLPPPPPCVAPSPRTLPPPPPHALPTGTLDDGDGGVVLGSRATGCLRHPRRSALACRRRTPTPASGAGQRPRTPPPTSSPAPAGRISGRPVWGSEPTPDLGAADLGSHRWALGREGEGEEEAAGHCKGGSPVDLGAVGVGGSDSPPDLRPSGIERRRRGLGREEEGAEEAAGRCWAGPEAEWLLLGEAGRPLLGEAARERR